MFGLQEVQDVLSFNASGNGDTTQVSHNASMQELTSECSLQSEAELYFSQNSSMCSSTSSLYSADQQEVHSDILDQAFSEVAASFNSTITDSLLDISFMDESYVSTTSGNTSFNSVQSFTDYSATSNSSTTYNMAAPSEPQKQCYRVSRSKGSVEKPKRKRIINKTQRKAANVRERRRMVTLNDAFKTLKTKIPVSGDEKKMSRIETLRTAISYITSMQHMIQMSDMQTNLSYPGHSGHHANQYQGHVTQQQNYFS